MPEMGDTVGEKSDRKLLKENFAAKRRKNDEFDM